MSEKPILFSAPLVRAILAGKKTVTRRLLKPRHDYFVEDGQPFFEQYVYAVPEPVGVPCPYGAPGDRLWVRETWQAWQCVSYERDEWDPITREVRCGERWAEWVELRGRPDKIEFRATSNRVGPWTPAIHMPRWASRITLEVASVRVERLHEITEEDARREGVEPFFVAFAGIGREQRITTGEFARDAEHRASFAVLWDEINGDRALWKANPWVWRVEFRTLPNPGGEEG